MRRPPEAIRTRLCFPGRSGASQATVLIVLASGVLAQPLLTVHAQEAPAAPDGFFRQKIGLSPDQIRLIGKGRAVAKILPSPTPTEIFVFGAVFVNATPAEYVRLILDTARMRQLPGYLGAGRFSDPPVLPDLRGFTLEPKDIGNLKECRPGLCDVQLPAEEMRELQELHGGADWSAPDIAEQVNERVQALALELVRRYQAEGNSVLGIYHDGDHPFDVNAQLRSILNRLEALPVYAPELNRDLLEHPNAAQPEVESSFYWEKVYFGLKPTLRINHAIVYGPGGPRGTAQVVAVKQLFASHYFQLALDLSACISANGRPEDRGFYLISIKGSIQRGLTGFRGSFLRRIVVSRTRAAQERNLMRIKSALEENR
jgi:hypothetical protein